MSAEATIEEYYDALRSDEPLVPYFAEREGLVKVGISERLVGPDAVAEGLREQSETTSDWTVESRDLRVTERESVAWFADEVRMAWSTEDGDEHDFEARWSGTLEREDSGERGRTPRSTSEDASDGEWLFVGMHVSVPQEL